MVLQNKSLTGEKFVAEYLEKKEGYKISKRPKGEKGYDFLATKEKKILRIEVKTSHGLWGVPDMHANEFDFKSGKWLLVPDRLYIVRLDQKNRPVQLDFLDKKDVNKYSREHRELVRIGVASRLKTDLRNKRVGIIEMIKVV